MDLTVKAALALPVLKEARVLAGEAGLGKAIERVTILDAPDISNWVSGNELILTNAYLFQTQPGLEIRLLKDFAAKGCAALGVKLGRFIESLSPEFLALADELAFPIIHIPFDAIWTDIINSVLTEVLAKHARMLEKADEIHRQFTQRALEGGGYQAVADTLGELIGRPVVVTDSLLTELTRPGPGDWGVDLRAILDSADSQALRDAYLTGEAQRKGRFAVSLNVRRAVLEARSFVFAPVIVTGRLWGHLFALEGDRRLASTDLLALEQAVTVAALEFLKEAAVREVERRFRANFIDDLLLANFESTEAMVRRARALGWDLSQPQLVVVTDVDNFEAYHLRQARLDPATAERNVQGVRDRMFQEVTTTLSRVDATLISMDRSDSIVILSAVKPPATPEAVRLQALSLAQVIQKTVAEHFNDLTISIGIGRFYDAARDLQKSYREARQALLVGRAMSGRNRIYHYDDLGLARILHGHPDRIELTAFEHDLLGRLEAYDAEHGTDLIGTLEAFLRCDGRLKTCAGQLYVHVNTLKYRLGRIKEMIGDFSEADRKVNLYVALKLRRLRTGYPLSAEAEPRPHHSAPGDKGRSGHPAENPAVTIAPGRSKTRANTGS